jgi:predicted negative regulator of RcsB-dependent stress response
MASSLDLHEREQLDALKAFWQRWGNLITWALALGLLVVAGINGWQWWQRKQAAQAAVLYDQIEAASTAADDAKALSAFTLLKDQYPGTVYAANAGLVTAKLQVGVGKKSEALQTLAWVSANAVEPEVRVLARLHAAGVMMDDQKFAEALTHLDGLGKVEGTLGALVSDRRGDALAMLGKREEARAAYDAAYKAMDQKVEYRQLVDAKRSTVSGPAPEASAPAPASAPTVQAAPASDAAKASPPTGKPASTPAPTGKKP